MGRKTRNHWGRAALFGLASTLTMATSVYAQNAAVEQQVQSINLEAGPLGDRLLQLGDVLGVSIFAADTLVAGKTAPAVSGAFTDEQAIEASLRGSGLTARRVGPGTFEISQDTAQSVESVADVIIVRGQRVERTEFETATSVSVFTNEDVENSPFLQNSQDILARIPNIAQAGTSASQVAVRGIDSTGSLVGRFAFAGGAIPRVTTLVDGYPLSYNEYLYGLTSIYDIDQVEVYRGPQTTAQGANAIAGAIFVFTKDPTFEFEGGALIEGGNHNTLQVAGHLSGPLIDDQLAARVSVDFRQRDSFVNFDGVSEVKGFELDRFESLNLRGKLLWTPSAVPNLTSKLTIFHNDGEAPSTENVIEPFESFNTDRTIRDNPTINTTSSTGAIVDASYELGESWKLTNQFSYSEYEYVAFGPVRTDDDNRSVDTQGTNVTNELILGYDPGQGRISGIAGVYVTSRDQDDLVRVRGDELVVDKRDSLGVFTEVTASLTDRLELTGGVRYEKAKQNREGVIFTTQVDFDESYDAFLPKVALAYDVNEDVRVGVSASRGFNPGGVNTQFFTGITTPFSEETVWTYDAFVRTNALDGRLQVNANVFFSDFDDFQRVAVIEIIPAEPFDNIITDISNIDSAESYGFEASAEFEANDFIRVFGSLGLLETSFEERVGVNEFDDFEFARAPEMSLIAGADLSPIENLTLSGQVRHTSSFFSTDQNLAVDEIDSVTVLDLSARYEIDRFEVYGYVENVTDELVLFQRFSQGSQPTAIPGRPRTFGVGARVSF